jgi:hypothetical protein
MHDKQFSGSVVLCCPLRSTAGHKCVVCFKRLVYDLVLIDINFNYSMFCATDSIPNGRHYIGHGHRRPFHE